MRTEMNLNLKLRNGKEVNMMYLHPYHERTDIDKKELEQELQTWPRERIVNWLSLNDPHGVYTDKDSLQEFGNIMPKEEGIEIMVRQIMERRW